MFFECLKCRTPEVCTNFLNRLIVHVHCRTNNRDSWPYSNIFQTNETPMSSAVRAGDFAGQQTLEEGATFRYAAAEPIAVDGLSWGHRVVLVRHGLDWSWLWWRALTGPCSGLDAPLSVLRLRHRRVQLADLVGPSCRNAAATPPEECGFHPQVPDRATRYRMGVSLKTFIYLFYQSLANLQSCSLNWPIDWIDFNMEESRNTPSFKDSASCKCKTRSLKTWNPNE